MDIDLLAKMVKETILDNDKVVLPGLGIFVAEMVPASFSDKGYTINPPYRRLYFRARQEKDDLLARLYSESNGISLEMAEKILSDFISELKSVLQVKKTVVFPGLGKLRATKENNFFFVADEDLDIYPEGMGLSPISLKSHNETSADLAEAAESLVRILNAGDACDSGQTADGGDEAVPSDEECAPEDAAEDAAEEAVEEAVEEVAAGEPAETADGANADDGNGVRTVAEDETHKRKKHRVLLAVSLSAVLLLVIVAAAFFILSQICPEFLDRLLYNKEQLEVLDYVMR